MKNLFLPYKESIELKELGFNEVCIAHYVNKTIKLLDYNVYNTELGIVSSVEWCTGITYQQIIEWFIKEHKLTYSLYPLIHTNTKQIWYEWVIYFLDEVNHELSSDCDFSSFKTIMSINNKYDDTGYFNTRRDAELNAINIIIKIIKEKNA